MGSKVSCKHPDLEKFTVRGPFEKPNPNKEYAYFQCSKCKLQCYRKREISEDGIKGIWSAWETEDAEEEEVI